MKLMKLFEEDIPKPTPPDQQQPQKKAAPSKPVEKKEEGLKYEGKYFNGGFADGVELEPVGDGKIGLTITVYGGGEPKKIKIPASGKMQKILRGYEAAFHNEDDLGTKMEPEIDQYLTNLKQQMSFKIITALREFDQKVKQIIIETIKANQ